MDIIAIDSINAELEIVEAALLKVDALIPKVSPDIKSTMETKKVIFALLNDLAVVRKDIADYREGKAIKIVTPKEALQNILDIMKKNPPPDFPFLT